MSKAKYSIGLGMLIIGAYMFYESMIMIMTGQMLDNWVTWTIYLTLGILLLSFGPGVLAYTYSKNYQKSVYSLTDQNRWQTIQIPRICSSCGNELEIHSLEWIGPNEARCPYCSNEVEVRSSLY